MRKGRKIENKTLSGGYLISYDIYPKGDHTSILKGFMFFEYEENNKVLK